MRSRWRFWGSRKCFVKLGKLEMSKRNKKKPPYDLSTPPSRSTINLSILNELQKEARHQAKLARTRILPSQADGVTKLISQYPWQFLLATSFLVSVIIELIIKS